MEKSEKPDWLVMKKEHMQKQQDNLAATVRKMDERARLNAFSNRMNMEKAENYLDDLIEKGKTKNPLSLLGKDKDIGREMIRLELKKAKGQKIRQHLQESVEELRELKSKMKNVCVAKELLIQIEQKKTTALEEMLFEKNFVQTRSNKHALETFYKIQECNTSDKKKQIYKESLEHQIAERKAFKSQGIVQEQLSYEKDIIDQIAKDVQDGNTKEKKTHCEKLFNNKQDIKEQIRMQEVWQKTKALELEEEDRKNKEYMELCERKEQIRKEDILKKAERNKLIESKRENDFLCWQKIQLSKDARFQVLFELDAERLLQLADKRHENEMASIGRVRYELSAAYNKQIAERKRRLQEQEYFEKRYKEQIAAEIEGETGSLQQAENERQQKIYKFKNEVQKSVEDRFQNKVEELQRRAAVDKLLQAEDKRKAQLVEEERLNILNENVCNLHGILPMKATFQEQICKLGPTYGKSYKTFLSKYSQK